MIPGAPRPSRLGDLLSSVRFGDFQRFHPDGSAEKKMGVQLLSAVKQELAPVVQELR